MSLLRALGFRSRRSLPFIRQSESGECGLACLAMIANYHGYKTELRSLRRRFSISRKGASLGHLTRIAARLNLATRSLRVDAKAVPYLRLPCILHWRPSHFVVLKSVRGRRLVILDPAYGERLVALDEASSTFAGVALEVWPEPTFERAVESKPVAIRQLIGAVPGLRRSLAQILVLAVSLDLLTIVLLIVTQVIVDNADRTVLTTLTIALALLIFMQVVIRAIRARATIYLDTLHLQWRSNVFSHLLRLPIGYFAKRGVADITSRFSSIDEIQRAVSTSFLGSLADGIFVVATVAVMFAYNATLALIMVAAAILYVCVGCLLYGPIQRAAERTMFLGVKETSHLVESVRGIRALKLFQKEDAHRSAWLGMVAQHVNSNRRRQKLEMIYEAWRGTIAGAHWMLVLWVGVVSVIGGTFTIGALVASLAYVALFQERMTKLVDNLMKLSALRIHAERLGDIVLTEPEPRGVTEDEGEQGSAEASIEIRDLRFRYADEEPYVLLNVNLRITHAECVGIVGEPGCGKTTLLNLILGWLTPTGGEISIVGLNPKLAGYERVRSAMGAVMQEDSLFAGTIAENVCFFDRNVDMERVKECAALAAVHEDVEGMSMRYDTPVGDMGNALPESVRYRVLLARALYKRPKILLLDEATSQVDEQRRRQMNEALRSLKITRIIVARRPESLVLADRCFLLQRSSVTELPRSGNRDGAASLAAGFPDAPPAS